MSTFRNVLRTYNSTMYAARATTAAVRRIKDKMKSYRNKPKTNVVKNVRAKIALKEPLYANKALFGKRTIAGKARRLTLAKTLKSSPRPQRSKTGDLRSVHGTGNAGPLPRRPYDGKLAIHAKTTGRDLKRQAYRKAIKSFTHDEVRATGTRQAAAASIKGLRKQGGITTKILPSGKQHSSYSAPTRAVIRSKAEPFVKHAANTFRKHFGKK